jgi:FMN phosphatase YigB (HAD superfamily)
MPEPRLIAFDIDGTLVTSYMDRANRRPLSGVDVLPGRAEHI